MAQEINVEDGIKLLKWKRYYNNKGKFWDINYQSDKLKKIFWDKYWQEKNNGLSVKESMSKAREYVENKELQQKIKINYKRE